jgi:hypothetical protein
MNQVDGERPRCFGLILLSTIMNQHITRQQYQLVDVLLRVDHGNGFLGSSWWDLYVNRIRKEIFGESQVNAGFASA